MEKTTLEGITLYLAHPDELNLVCVGQEEIIRQVLAAWMIIDKKDLPLNPRLIGKPGAGKTTIAYAAAQRLGKAAYIFQATVDTRPEDLLITPVISDEGKIRYMASPIVTAMIKGGVAIIDEANRMSEKSWASLAPLLDSRRYIESVVAGIKIQAHEDFRLCVTMNEDASTFELPEYIYSRLQPQIYVDFPDAEEEEEILRANLPFADEEIIHYVVSFLQIAHKAGESFSIRDGVNIARYALKLLKISSQNKKDIIKRSISQILGPGALFFWPEKDDTGRYLRPVR